LVKLRRVQVLELFEHAPDVVAGSKRILGIHILATRGDVTSKNVTVAEYLEVSPYLSPPSMRDGRTAVHPGG
jgi:hypothetical protein